MDHPKTLNSRRRDATVRLAVMALLTVLFTGYLLILIMMPTNTFKQTWLPVTRAKTATTYFGPTQGATYLLFTLPLLFIAVLGCVHLHLNRMQGGGCGRGCAEHRLGIWRRPMIVKGLGIVSRIELAFFLMFLALLAWNLAMYLHNDFAKITAAESGEKVWEEKLDKTALRLGLVGNIALNFLFFPVTRGSSVLPLLGLTSEASVKYHIWLGHIVMTIFSAHGLCYIIFWASTHQISQMLEWSKTGVSNLPGELSLLAGLVLWTTTFPRIRRKFFELFFYTHHLYILFVVFFVLHVGISFSCIMLPGFFLFMIDRFLRFLQSRKGIRLMSARLLPSEIVELNFSKSKGLSYSPTSVLFVNVPSISKLQWHPFTITSCSDLESDKISVIIKGEGSWSRKLNQMLDSPSSIDRLDVSLEGPYGPASVDSLRHDLLVMISGGSGLTPFISIIRELMHVSQVLKRKTPKVLLVASFKNSADLAMLDLILPISGAPSELPDLALQIEAYITREKQPTTMQDKKPIRTIWFKPKPSDAPLTPILSQNNNWLWLGAIVSSSFIIYLIFISILTRYCIYPIDHNTYKVYPATSRNVLHILFLCIGVVISATAAFLWNKNENAIETRQIQSMEGVTPTSTPTSWFYNTDRELESFPQQPFWQSVNMHYGERPDLKRLLFERKELSVGVVVSGPKQMRHEVARICSAGLASNLHFESISFSW